MVKRCPGAVMKAIDYLIMAGAVVALLLACCGSLVDRAGYELLGIGLLVAIIIAASLRFFDSSAWYAGPVSKRNRPSKADSEAVTSLDPETEHKHDADDRA